MGGDIIPMLVDQGQAHVYDFADNKVPGETDRDRGYWRDVGTIDAYYEAHMDLVSVRPVFNLYNQAWPIRTATPPLPPAKFIAGGSAEDSMVGPGSIISGTVHGSVISSDVVVETGSVVQGSVLLQAGSPLAAAFCRSRLGGAHGLAMGTLSADLPFADIIERALPTAV